jgi:hypothetical protein
MEKQEVILLSVVVFWVMTPCSLAGGYQHFIWSNHLQEHSHNPEDDSSQQYNFYERIKMKRWIKNYKQDQARKDA